MKSWKPLSVLKICMHDMIMTGVKQNHSFLIPHSKIIEISTSVTD